MNLQVSPPYELTPDRLAETGVPGLDQILNGGWVRNHVYLIEGDPGTGKSTLAMQFLLRGAADGERGLYVTLSESSVELHQTAASHGWSLDKLDIFEVTPAEAGSDALGDYTVFHAEEVELGQTTKIIIDKINELKPSRVVLDSLAEFRLMSRDSMRYRRQLLALKQFFTGREVTVLLLDDRTSQTQDKQLHSVVHGVLTLERLPREYGSARRRLEIGKLRGRKFSEGYHDYAIKTGGISVYPRLVASQHHGEFKLEGVSSNVRSLDELLGGGLDRGSAALFVGPAGAGKTTLATQYAVAAMGRSEPVAIFTFDEGLPTLISRAESLGMPLRRYVNEGRVRIEQVDPAELSPGEFACRVRASVETEGAQMIVIDSLNGYLTAMPEEHFLTLQMHELLTFLNQKGVVTILILAQQGVLGQLPPVVDVSYLADTIVLLRFFEANGEVHRALSVVKKRSGAHERTIREMEIGAPEIITVGEPLRDFQGVLTGVPEYKGPTELLTPNLNDRGGL